MSVKKAAGNLVQDVEQEVEKVVDEVKGDVEKDVPAVEADLAGAEKDFEAAVSQVEEDVKTQSGPVTEQVYQDALVAEDLAKKELVVLRSKVGMGQVHLEEDLAAAKAAYEKALAELHALEEQLVNNLGANPFRPKSLNDGNP